MASSGGNSAPVPVGSLFGFIGTSYGTAFVDSNITADFTQVPPVHNNPFARGAILQATPSAVGSGYTTVTITITTSTGSGFVGEGIISGGSIVGYVIQNGGSGYAPGDTASVSGDGTGATASIVVGPQTGTYPGVVAYYQQRRVYASSLNSPDTYWMSKPGLFTNFDSSIPVADDDAITGTPWAQQINGIQFMLPMPGGLVVMTGLGAWQVTGSGGSAQNPVAITPSSQQAQPQAFNGCSNIVPPIPIDYDILYIQSKGSIARDLAYSFWTNNYTGSDLTQLSGQLFTGYTISQWAYCEEPYKVVWAVRNDGILLSLTYLKLQEVYGWARHDTQGTVLSVASVTEPPVDALYLVVERTNLATGSYYAIERMDNRIWSSVSDPWCVDCGVGNVFGSPTSVVTGLDHLDGLFVTGLADGWVIPPTQVFGGSITLPYEALNVKVGLSFTAQVQTPYLNAQANPTIQGRRKSVTGAIIRMEQSINLQAGINQTDGSTLCPPEIAPAWTSMEPMINNGANTTSPTGVPVTLLWTGDTHINVPADWDRTGQVAVQQVYPQPMQILAIEPEYLEGDLPEVGYSQSQQSDEQKAQQQGRPRWMMKS